MARTDVGNSLVSTTRTVSATIVDATHAYHRPVDATLAMMGPHVRRCSSLPLVGTCPQYLTVCVPLRPGSLDVVGYPYYCSGVCSTTPCFALPPPPPPPPPLAPWSSPSPPPDSNPWPMSHVGMSWGTKFEVDATYTLDLSSGANVTISTSSRTPVSAPPCSPPTCIAYQDSLCGEYFTKNFYAAAEAQKCTQLFAIKVPLLGPVVLSAKLGTSDGSSDDNPDDQDDSFVGDTVTGGLYWSKGEGPKCEGDGAHTVPGIGGDTPLECDVCYPISIPGVPASALSGTFGVRCPFDAWGFCNIVRPRKPLSVVFVCRSRIDVSVWHTQAGIELGLHCYIGSMLALLSLFVLDILWGLNPKGACTICHKRTPPACTNRCSLYYQCHVCWCPTHALVQAAENVGSGVISSHAPYQGAPTQTIVTPLLPAVSQSRPWPPPPTPLASTMQVTCPPDGFPGKLVQIMANGQLMTVPIPQGVRPNQPFIIQVQVAPQSRARSESLSKSDGPLPEGLKKYTVVHPSVIRANISPKSSKVGEATVGEVIVVSESGVSYTGVARVKCDRGWLSVRATDGTVLLEQQSPTQTKAVVAATEREEDQGGQAANVAEPITQPAVAAAVDESVDMSRDAVVIGGSE